MIINFRGGQTSYAIAGATWSRVYSTNAGRVIVPAVLAIIALYQGMVRLGALWRPAELVQGRALPEEIAALFGGSNRISAALMASLEVSGRFLAPLAAAARRVGTRATEGQRAGSLDIVAGRSGKTQA